MRNGHALPAIADGEPTFGAQGIEPPLTDSTCPVHWRQQPCDENYTTTFANVGA